MARVGGRKMCNKGRTQEGEDIWFFIRNITYISSDPFFFFVISGRGTSDH